MALTPDAGGEAYAPGMKEAYAWWATEFIEGFRDKFDDRPREGEASATILILAIHATDPLPKKGDVIYFELPTALGTVNSLRAQVHIYIFTTRPPSPREALANLAQARASLWCQTKGLEVERGGVELRADWYIESARNPVLKRASQPFRPRTGSGMQQVRVQVWNSVFDRFEYLFTSGRQTWQPMFDFEHPVQAPVHAQEELNTLKLTPREHLEWYRVVGLSEGTPSGSENYRKALAEPSLRDAGRERGEAVEQDRGRQHAIVGLAACLLDPRGCVHRVADQPDLLLEVAELADGDRAAVKAGAARFSSGGRFHPDKCRWVR